MALNNHFQLEKLRGRLAKEWNLPELAETYKIKAFEIVNKNTSGLWDKLNVREPLRRKTSPMALHRYQIVEKWIVEEDPQNVLDIGFGSGFLEDRLYKHRTKIKWEGIDISPQSIKNARHKYPLWKFKVGDVTRDPIPKNRYNVVVLLEVLEHISPHDTFNVLKKVYSSLHSGGKFIVSVPLNENLEEMVKSNTNYNEHVRIYNQTLLTAELTIAGFITMKSHVNYAFHNNYQIKSYLVKNLPFLFNKKPNNLILIASKP